MNEIAKYESIAADMIAELEDETYDVNIGLDLWGTVASALPAVAEFGGNAINDWRAGKAAEQTAAQLDAKVAALATLDQAAVNAAVDKVLASKAYDDAKSKNAQAATLNNLQTVINAKDAVLTRAVATVMSKVAELTPEAAQKHVGNMQASANDAAVKWAATPSNYNLQARSEAWNALIAQVTGTGALTPGTPAAAADAAAKAAALTGGDNFFTKRAAGLPVWGWVSLGGVALVGLAVGIPLALRSRNK